MTLPCTDFKLEKLVEGNCKLYVFVYFFIVVVVNIWISLFIKLYNLYFLRNTLRKIPKAATSFNQFCVPTRLPSCLGKIPQWCWYMHHVFLMEERTITYHPGDIASIFYWHIQLIRGVYMYRKWDPFFEGVQELRS